MKSLHIYGQYLWHDDVQIVGNPKALKKLRDIIEEALEKGDSQAAPFFTGDGEGYGVTVSCADASEETWGTFLLPYTADYAQENRPDAKDPRKHFQHDS